MGIVNFGGGYAMLPLLQKELCEKRGWTTEEEIANYYAVGQSTPGAIAVNVATFIGKKRCGILGGIAATLGFVSPAFIIIFLIASILTNFIDNQYVKYALNGIYAVVLPLIIYGISKLFKSSIVDIFSFILAILTAILAITVKQIPLYVYILFAAVYGIVVSLIKNKGKKEMPLDQSDIIVEKKEKTNKLLFVLGMFLGITLGAIAIPFAYIFRKKELKEGIYSTLILWLILLASTLVCIFNNGNPLFFRLFIEFFRIGLCAFGGGLATIPFLTELSETLGWFTIEELNMMIAISESTPGAIGVNMSTYVGYLASMQAFNNPFLGFLGSIISTLGLVSPSIIVIILISLVLEKFNKNKYVKYLMYGLRAASVGLIICACYSIFKTTIFNHYDGINSIKYAYENMVGNNFFEKFSNFLDLLVNYRMFIVSGIFLVFIFKIKKHPIFYIILGAIIGLILQL